MLTVLEILTELRDHGELSEVVSPGVTDGAREGLLVPTLSRGDYVHASPMLAERFKFADSWLGPAALRFYSVHDMARAWASESELHAKIACRRDYWEGALMATLPAKRVTLLAANDQDSDEVYLLWDEGRAEPRVVAYFGHSEEESVDLREFLLEFV